MLVDLQGQHLARWAMVLSLSLRTRSAAARTPSYFVWHCSQAFNFHT